MKTSFTPFLLVAILGYMCRFNAFGQVTRFGDIDQATLRMAVYEKDTAAAAVVLADEGSLDVVIGTKVEYVYKRHVRIKVLKKAGYDWANVEVPYLVIGNKAEKVYFIKGITYNLSSGKVTEDKLKDDAVFAEQSSGNRYLKKFVMPNVKVGSVLEYSYTVSSDFLFNLRPWNFQHSIPVVWSEYRVKVPEYFEFKLVKQGDQPLYTPEQLGLKYSFNQEGNRWIAKDVPALTEEPYATALEDYVTRLEFELYKIKYPNGDEKVFSGNWQETEKFLMDDEYFGKQLQSGNAFSTNLAAIKQKNASASEQALAVYELVRGRMKWDGRNSFIARKSVQQAYADRKGSAAEINLMLIAMLKEAGLEASPVLVSTRGFGRPYKKAPILSKFDYVVAYVKAGDQELLLDATEPVLQAGMLPLRCLNGEGFLLNEADSKWIALQPKAAHTKYFVGNFAVDAQGGISGAGAELLSGYSALATREAINSKGEDKYKDDAGLAAGSLRVTVAGISDLDSLQKPLTVRYSITSANPGNNAIVYLSPMLGLATTESPFKVPTRTYPVNYPAPVSETFVCNYQIPTGWQVEETPANITVSLPDRSASFRYLVQQTGNMVQVVSKLSIDKMIFTPEEYRQLREFYRQAVAKHAEQIVLKRSAVN